VASLPDKYKQDTRFYSFNDFLEFGKSVPDSKIDELIKKQQPG
jgi:hypothetical protein